MLTQFEGPVEGRLGFTFTSLPALMRPETKVRQQFGSVEFREGSAPDGDDDFDDIRIRRSIYQCTSHHLPPH